MAFYIEDQNHKRTEQILDDPQETIMRLCEAAPERSVLYTIARYGDTMLNIIQMRQMIDELSNVQDGEYREAATILSAAAERAIRLRGYLYFSGD